MEKIKKTVVKSFQPAQDWAVGLEWEVMMRARQMLVEVELGLSQTTGICEAPVNGPQSATPATEIKSSLELFSLFNDFNCLVIDKQGYNWLF